MQLFSHYCKRLLYSRILKKTWGFGWGHFKTQRKRIIMLQINKWRPLVNEYSSGARSES